MKNQNKEVKEKKLKKYGYIHFPLPWLRGMMGNKKIVISRILKDGIDCPTASKFFTEANTSLKREMLIEFLETEKTESEMIDLLYYAGIRSIAGSSNIEKTNRHTMLLRAFGYESHTRKDPNILDPFFGKYAVSINLQTEVLRRLQTKPWDVKMYTAPDVCGTLVSVRRRVTHDDLIAHFLKSKPDYKAKELRIEKEKARIRVANKLAVSLLLRESGVTSCMA